MNNQNYYAVLSDTLVDNFNQPKVIDYLGCYDFAYDALERFLMFHDSRYCTLYSYETMNAEGRLVGLIRVQSELPPFDEIMQTILV